MTILSLTTSHIWFSGPPNSFSSRLHLRARPETRPLATPLVAGYAAARSTSVGFSLSLSLILSESGRVIIDKTNDQSYLWG